MRFEDAVERNAERALRVANRMFHKTEPARINAGSDPRYHDWFMRHRVTDEELEKQRLRQSEFTTVFSIVVPLYRTPLAVFSEMIESVQRQSYGKWQLVLVNASPEDDVLKQAVNRLSGDDGRILVVTLEKNLGITANTNKGVEAATGDYVCFFDHDDLLEPNVLFEYAQAIADDSNIGLLYCDEDKLDECGRYIEPHFKPDFNIDLLRSNNYVCHFLCVKSTLLNEIGPNHPRYDGAQDHALTLRVSELACDIMHIPKVLYHWRISAGSTASREAVSKNAKSYANEAGRLAIQDHLDRLSIPGTVVSHRYGWPFYHEVEYRVKGRPQVSVVVFGGRAHMAKGSERSLLLHSSYEALEIIIPDERVLQEKGVAAHANEGAKIAQGEFLLFLDAGLRLVPELSKRPIEMMLGMCQREDVGAVGGLVLHRDNAVCQSGMVSCGPWIEPESANEELPFSMTGYMNYREIARDYSFISSSCMMLHRGTFEALGGFDDRYRCSNYDADLCLKLRAANYCVVYEPRAIFRLSRNNLASKELDASNRDVDLLFARWPEFFSSTDPYFNPGFGTPQFELDNSIA